MISIKIKINVDLNSKMEAIEEACEKGLNDLTMAAFKEWQDEAGRRLHTTRRMYQDALSYSMVDKKHGEIKLQPGKTKLAWLILALENGLQSYDMKPGFMESHSAYHWSPLHKTLANKKKKAEDDFIGKSLYGKGMDPPFVDVPFRLKSKEQNEPDYYRRVHSRSTGWIHPGFKPIGKGGPGSMAPHVIEYIKKTAGDVFLPLIKARISV